MGTVNVKLMYVCPVCKTTFSADETNRVCPKDGCTGIGRLETSNEKFCRIANKRVPATKRQLRLVENLFKSQAYSWTPEQAQAVIGELSDFVVRITQLAEGTPHTAIGETFKLTAS